MCSDVQGMFKSSLVVVTLWREIMSWINESHLVDEQTGVSVAANGGTYETPEVDTKRYGAVAGFVVGNGLTVELLESPYPESASPPSPEWFVSTSISVGANGTPFTWRLSGRRAKIRLVNNTLAAITADFHIHVRPIY